MFYIYIFSHHLYNKNHNSNPSRDIHTRDFSDLSSPNPLLPSLSFSVQFLSAWVLVCSELQSGARSFIQNQMCVWQPLHLRHFIARQPRLGKLSIWS